jgi:hypothetical protein
MLFLASVLGAGSLDHLGGADEQRCWYLNRERHCRSQIDDELELGGLHHRQIGRRGAFEDAARYVPTRRWRLLGPINGDERRAPVWLVDRRHILGAAENCEARRLKRAGAIHPCH